MVVTSRSPHIEVPESKPDGVPTVAVEVRGLNFFYGQTQALSNINMDITPNKVTALIGPSGCGKSTFLRCLNRMNDVIPGIRLTGTVKVLGQDIYAREVRLERLRKSVGMVFQKSNPFPMSILENITFGPRIAGTKDRARLNEIAEEALNRAHLWHEVSDRLQDNALDLSGGQQQRVCIARALANNPQIILMDEPASALDPISTAKIEETIIALKKHYTVVIVTHNMQQAARISDYVGFFYQGKLIEFDTNEVIFQNPKERQTEDYITGRFG